MTTLKVPKKLKERLQQIGIALAWGDKEKALEILDQDYQFLRKRDKSSIKDSIIESRER